MKIGDTVKICLLFGPALKEEPSSVVGVGTRFWTRLPWSIQHFNNQLTHTTLKDVELLKHFKISKTAPTCFGLQGNHHQ